MFASKFFVLFACLAVAYAAPKESDSVSVSLVYEGLCPYCHDFFLNQLYPTYQKLGDALDINLIPLGNAKVNKINETSFTITCQHGEQECFSNRAQACVLNHKVDTPSTLDFVKCLFEGEPDQKTVEQCIMNGSLKAKWTDIKICLESAEADQLLYELQKIQKQLSPPPEYVPWILINKVHDDNLELQARLGLFKLACSLLSPKPSACTDVE